VKPSPTEIDEAQAVWEAAKVSMRQRLRAMSPRRHLVNNVDPREIAVQFGFHKDFDLWARLNVAARDYFAHASLDTKGEVAKLERRELQLLRTLRRRLSAGRAARVKATIEQLGMRGHVRLVLKGWTGETAHQSLALAVDKAIADAAARTGRYPSARVLWALALTCIYAEGTRKTPTVTRSKTGAAAGPLADFLAACSAAASVRTPAVPVSTLLRIVKSDAVAHFSAKKIAPF